jgi:basic amino acid/polyamine antiporter, APA family
MDDPKPKGISLAAAIAIVVASMVGTGVFTSLGFQLAGIPSGFPILLLWLLGGVLSLCGAFCYAELCAMMPRSGGEYHLLGTAYHPSLGFLAGWVSATAGFAAPIAAAALLFGTYVHDIWPGLEARSLSIGLVLAVTLIQLWHVQIVGRVQLAFTLLKVLLIFAFIVGAVTAASTQWGLLAPKPGDTARVLSMPFAESLVYVMYAYAGWNGAAYVVGEMRDAKRNLPIALVAGTLIVMLLYVGLNAVFLVGAPWAAMTGKEQVALTAAVSIFGEKGGHLMGGLIALGLIAHVSAMMLAGTRVLRVIGQDAWLLRWLDFSNRHGTPWVSVLVLSCTVLVFVLESTFQQLVLYIQSLLLLSALLCVGAVPWLRWMKPDAPRPFRTPLYPLTPLVFIAITVWMLVGLAVTRPFETMCGALTLVIGIILYMVSPKVLRSANQSTDAA